MKTLEQLDKEIAALQAERERVAGWLPEVGQLYWFADTGNNLGQSKFISHLAEHWRFQCGNASTEQRHVETLIKQREKWGRFTMKAIELADGWEPSSEYRFFYVYWLDDSFIVDWMAGGCLPNTIPLPDETTAQKLADWANENLL